MKKVFLLLFIVNSGVCFCQSGDPVNSNSSKYIPTDSVVENIIVPDSFAIMAHTRDSIRERESMDRNINGILQMQKEQRAKQKKAAITRIVIGAGFLVILIIGLMRKRNTRTK